MIFGGRAGAPITSHFRKKTMEIIRFSMISGLGRGPGTSHLRKNYRNHNVFNDFGDGLRTPISPHRAKKLLKSVPSYSQELHSPPAPAKRSCETSKWASSGSPARLWPFKPCAEPCADLVPSMAVLFKKKVILGILSGEASKNTRISMDRHPPAAFALCPPARSPPAAIGFRITRNA